MPKVVKVPKGKEFTFTSGVKVSKYPWDEWFNNTLLLLERTVRDDDGKVTEKRDYDTHEEAMAVKLKLAARRKYKAIQISKRDFDGNRLVDSLIIRTRDMTPEERLAEDTRRAEEKDAKSRAKAEANGQAEPAPTGSPQVA